MGTNEKLVPGELLETLPGLRIRKKQILITNKLTTQDCLNKNTNEEIAHV